MSPRRARSLLKWCGLLASAAVGVVCAQATAAPASRPASAPAAWGEPKAGVQTSLGLPAEPVADGKLILHLTVRNTGPSAATLEKGFWWLMIAVDKDRKYFSEKRPLDAEPLAAGASIDKVVDAAGLKLFVVAPGLKVTDGYPKPDADAPDPQPIGTLEKLLADSPGKVRLMLYLPGPLDAPPGFRSPLLPSNMIELSIPLTGDGRTIARAKLLKQFRTDEYAAMEAHHQAVKLGADVVPDLIQAAGDDKAPDFARMWLTTTLIDIGDARAIDTLVNLLQTGPPSVRYVVAYHGPKMKNAKLDEAILTQAQSGRDPLLAAWAARGFAANGRPLPDKLLEIALASREPKARAEAADALARKPDEKNVGRLLTLLKDDAEQVRAAAAKAMVTANLHSHRALAAMVDSLDQKGDYARQSICEALTKLTAQKLPYDADATPAEKQKTIDAWKSWWATHGKEYQ